MKSSIKPKLKINQPTINKHVNCTIVESEKKINDKKTCSRRESISPQKNGNFKRLVPLFDLVSPQSGDLWRKVHVEFIKTLNGTNQLFEKNQNLQLTVFYRNYA